MGELSIVIPTKNLSVDVSNRIPHLDLDGVLQWVLAVEDCRGVPLWVDCVLLYGRGDSLLLTLDDTVRVTSWKDRQT